MAAKIIHLLFLSALKKSIHNNLNLPGMQVHRDITKLPLFKNAAVTIGTFDGVHCGHVQIINQLKKEARENNGESVIITFDPHPRMILNEGKKVAPINLLNTLPEKTALLKQQGIDHLVIVPFTKDFSEQTAEEYIENFLVDNFHPQTIIIGYDHHFGKDRKGDYKLLEEFQQKFNYKVKEIPVHVLHHVTISSTKIRQALCEGDIQTANECLGYDYFFEGRVIDGNKLGRTLGYPTANIHVNNENKLIPANGIYAVTVSIESENDNDSSFPLKTYKGMMSIGLRPTIGGKHVVIEVNIFDFEKDIYNRNVRVFMKHFLRKEEKFESIEELKIAMDNDKLLSQELLSGDSDRIV
jgi:riboflavin kinase/FMN adenylyltransferase